MTWVDPAAMSDSEIEAELGELVAKLDELRRCGGKIGELEARQWRLRFEQRFRRGDSHVLQTDDRRRTGGGQAGVF
jgi:hypothetical protein